MTYASTVSRFIDADSATLFDKLADLRSWPGWMPPDFRTARTVPSQLSGLSTFHVKAKGVPLAAKLKICEFTRPVGGPGALAWTGGVPGILFAVHRFVFEPAGLDRTKVTSIESWTGVLAPMLAWFILPIAEKVGVAQLEGLARA